jgi:hypothetical protein
MDISGHDLANTFGLLLVTAPQKPRTHAAMRIPRLAEERGRRGYSQRLVDKMKHLLDYRQHSRHVHSTVSQGRPLGLNNTTTLTRSDVRLLLCDLTASVEGSKLFTRSLQGRACDAPKQHSYIVTWLKRPKFREVGSGPVGVRIIVKDVQELAARYREHDSQITEALRYAISHTRD